MNSERDWTPYWRSFRFFNVYRLLLALLFLLAPWLVVGTVKPTETSTLYLLAGTYVVLTGISLITSLFQKKYFQAQLTTQILVDIGIMSALVLYLDGQKTSLGIALLVSVAGASLVAQGRYALFYAALASSSVLLIEAFSLLDQGDVTHLSQAGFLSLGFFATAISAHLLGRRLVANENLAHRRGLALENQIHVSRRIMERMQDGVLVVKPDGRILQANPQALNILKDIAEEGQSLADIRPELFQHYLAWRDKKGDKRSIFSLPQGKEISARFARTQSSDGAALVFLEDLDQLREQAQQLKLASLGRLTASIAHEIRNPLSAISHAGDLLAEETDEQIKIRLLRIIRDNTYRLDRVIQDVLVLGKQRHLPQENIALSPYLQEFTQFILAQEHLPPEIIEVNVPVQSQLCFVSGQLHQILWNIVSNALRYSSRQPGAVKVRGVETQSHIELHVVDDGPGIPDDLREQIFEPFFTTASQGTGLGLHIARELAEANGARLLLGHDTRGAHFILIGRKSPCPLQEMNDAAEEN